MSTLTPDRKAAIARENGAKSTGPRSAAGIAKCRQAALRRHHATCVDPTLLPGESAAAFDEFQRALRAEWAPRSLTQTQLVDELIHIQWTIRRIYFAQSEERRSLIVASSASTPAARLAEAELAALSPALDLRLQRLNQVRSRLLTTLQKLAVSPIEALETNHLVSDPPLVAPILEESTEPEPESVPEPEPQPQPEPEPIEQWAEQNFGFIADPAQRELFHTQENTLVLGARQTGKSTAAALKVLYEALRNPNRQILLGGPSHRQSGQIMEKAKRAAEQLAGRLKGAGPGNQGFTLPNGAQIIALPDNEFTVRGFSNPLLVVIDEAAFVTDEIFKALLPAQAVGRGQVILLSTPNGQSGFFFEQWQSNQWRKIEMTAAACPRLTEDWLRTMRLHLGADGYKQEFECQFLVDPGAIFTAEMFDRSVSPDVLPLMPWEEQPPA